MHFCRLLFSSFVFLPPPLICEGLPFLPCFCVCLCFWGEKADVLSFFFFSYICQAGKRDVGRDCSAKSAAEWERKLLMNECQSFSFARCSWGHFTWMVSGCVLSATGETKMLHCCCWAFSVILSDVSLTHLPEKHVVHTVSSSVVPFM